MGHFFMVSYQNDPDQTILHRLRNIGHGPCGSCQKRWSVWIYWICIIKYCGSSTVFSVNNVPLNITVYVWGWIFNFSFWYKLVSQRTSVLFGFRYWKCSQTKIRLQLRKSKVVVSKTVKNIPGTMTYLGCPSQLYSWLVPFLWILL